MVRRKKFLKKLGRQSWVNGSLHWIHKDSLFIMSQINWTLRKMTWPIQIPTMLWERPYWTHWWKTKYKLEYNQILKNGYILMIVTLIDKFSSLFTNYYFILEMKLGIFFLIFKTLFGQSGNQSIYTYLRLLYRFLPYSGVQNGYI